MQHSPILATGAAALVFTSAACAATGEISIHNMPYKENIMLFGTVEKIKDPREFTLRDNSGSVNVHIVSRKGTVLNEGDTVTVTGTVIDKDIKASEVLVDRRADS